MIRACLFDLDGTIYHGTTPVPGAVALLQRLRACDRRLLFITNNATRTAEDICAHLAALGIDCHPGEIVTSAQAAAAHVGEAPVFCIGEAGLRQALQAAGAQLGAPAPTHVVVGLDRRLRYESLAAACRQLRRGAAFVATNPDRLLNTADGVAPGNGSVIAILAAATGVAPMIIGKPAPAIVRFALQRLHLAPEEAVLIGDNVATDIPAGVAAGVATVLLLTGISSRRDAESAAVQPGWIASDYDELERLFAELALL